jgi:glycosyltransferase involved in cell wall biosynthesis
MSLPRVSVVLPVYNARATLRRAVKSILRQGFKDFELLLIDDESTDGSLESIESLADPRIVIIKNGPKHGLVPSLNRGLDAARGEYIARMDADDISLPWRFAAQVRAMDKEPELCVCGAQIIKFKSSGVFKPVVLPRSDKAIKVFQLFSTCFAHPSVMIRKSVLDRWNIRYNEGSISEDYRLWVDLMDKGRFANLGIPALLYRLSEANLTAKIAKSAASTQERARQMTQIMRDAFLYHGLAFDEHFAELAQRPHLINTEAALIELRKRFASLAIATRCPSVIWNRFRLILRGASVPLSIKLKYFAHI